MAVLDTKLLRDLRRLWAQSLAIALVVAGGVSTVVLAVGSLRSLEETRIAYYERYAFADVFALARRAPKTLLDQIAEIPGVAAVEGRITKLALLDIPQLREPVTGQFVSLPESGRPILNRLHLRMGRMPDPGSVDEVVVTEGFAKAHAFPPGSHFTAILNGRKRELIIVGIALSPEYVYAVGPGDRMPDERRFAIVWMPEKALATAYDLDGAFSSVSLKLLREASERDVIKRLDALLDRYGGQAAYGRRDQTSHAYLDHGLDMLRNMSRTLPPIFLLVAAFLINMTLSRIVSLEREQIGLLKALGYRDATVAWHYVKFVIALVAIGIVVGGMAGAWLGTYVTRLYGEFYRFPFLVFAQSPDVYVAAAALSLGAAIVGAARAVRDVVTLPPAIAMQPPAPPRFRRLLPPTFAVHKVLSQSAVMMARDIASHPIRTMFTMAGISLSTGILIASLFLNGSMEALIDVTYFMSDRQDAVVSFVERRPRNVVNQIARLPGVLAAEPYREVPARIRKGNIERRATISGRPNDSDLSRIIDTHLNPVVLPGTGLAISSWLAQVLGTGVGDFVEVDLLEGQRRTVSLPVTALIEDYFGIQGIMEADALARLMREAPAVNTVSVSLDPNARDQFYDAVRRLPAVSGIALQRVSLANFREALAVLVTTMANIYTGLAAVIAFGVVYNTARISLSERARELATLRVLGFTKGGVLRILLLELALLTLLAQPMGWAIGYGLAWTLEENMAGELMRAPLVVEPSTYVVASAMVAAAALFSALVVRERVNRLDIVEILKTRD
ncbi:ABC transporter permease [Mesorhizobium sp. L-8-3]|uniref:ABC transporter permease n=1 Tax=Mesorhizobium sp. L-8-3 TaxID=2744522 RepID=UPI001927A3B4|nr:FtsX-like permease family protein [Mesorhizobium sp. L-8-3]BCH25042.1 peptide ABC transporter permease [Mesorhizobium sp. L-8-3]